MLLLTFGVAILDRHTRFAHLETGASLLAALGAIVVHHHTFTSYYESWVSWVVYGTWQFSLVAGREARSFQHLLLLSVYIDLIFLCRHFNTASIIHNNYLEIFILALRENRYLNLKHT
jgi:hypothetical protein